MATYLLDLPNAEFHIKDTLGHEMIHYWLWERGKAYWLSADPPGPPLGDLRVVDLSTVLSYALPPWQALTFFIPDFFGNPSHHGVFSLLDLNQPPVDIPLDMSDPRSLALSPDRSTVYVCALDSGNRTTVVPTAVVQANGSQVTLLGINPYQLHAHDFIYDT
jgi:hypothetical protein